MNDLYAYFNSISPIKMETWKNIEKIFKELNLNKGDYFAREAELSKQIGFLTKGVIRAFYRNHEGLEYNKHFFISNNMVGAYSSLITHKKNKINLQCLTDCQLWVADYKEIQKLYDLFPEFERFGRRIAELFFVNKEQRELEIVLLNADERYLIFQKEYPELEQLIPQYHIASYLGISATQLSRIRRKISEK